MNKDKITDVCSCMSPVGPSKKVKAAVRKAVKNIKKCPDPDLTGIKRFFLSKFGIPEECILFADSLKELSFFIPEALKPKKVLIIGPAPGIYEESSRAAGAEISYLNADEISGFVLRADEIKEKVECADLLFIADPNRITGRSVGKNSLYEIFSTAAEKKVRVVMDESLVEFATDECCYKDFLSDDNFIFLRTTANFYGLPGLELAYAISSAGTIGELKKKMHWEINNLAVAAAKTALIDSAYKKSTKIYVRREKEIILKALKKTGGLRFYDSDSNILLLKLNHPSKEMFDLFEAAGFSIKDCRDIKGLDESFLRFSVMKHDYNIKFIKILTGFLKNILND